MNNTTYQHQYSVNNSDDKGMEKLSKIVKNSIDSDLGITDASLEVNYTETEYKNGQKAYDIVSLDFRLTTAVNIEQYRKIKKEIEGILLCENISSERVLSPFE